MLGLPSGLAGVGNWYGSRFEHLVVVRDKHAADSVLRMQAKLLELQRHRTEVKECMAIRTNHKDIYGGIEAAVATDARFLTRVVEEQLFARPMYLSHAEPTSIAPARVQLAKLAVLVWPRIALFGSRFVLAPQQLQRDADTAELAMKPLEIDRCPRRWLTAADMAEQPRLDLRVAEWLSLRPAEPSACRAAQVVADRRGRHLARQRDLAVLAAALVVKTKNLSNLAHRQSPHGPRPSPPRASAARPTLIECPEWLIE
jgi:hypothetical protein